MFVVLLVPSASWRLLTSCCLWEPIQVSAFLSYIVSIRGMPELLLVLPYHVYRSCIGRMTLSWIGTPLGSIFPPGIVVTGSWSRPILRSLFRSWLRRGGWSRPVLVLWWVLTLIRRMLAVLGLPIPSCRYIPCFLLVYSGLAARLKSSINCQYKWPDPRKHWIFLIFLGVV